jgi:DME family drug/metabolite transporter
VVLGNLFAFAAVLPMALPVAPARPADWTLVVYLGVFQIGVAYALLLSALRHVAALEASLLMFVEPVLSPVWAWLFHGEKPGTWALAGGAVILATTAVRGWSERAGPLPITPPPE